MPNPGVSAERYFHLDGYNGWRFANRSGEVEPEHLPGVVVSAEGLTLPRGGLPAGVVDARVMGRARARGLAFDRLGRAYAVSEDRRTFCLVAGCEVSAPDAWQLAPSKSRRLGGMACDGRQRLYVALPDEAEVRVLGISPARELTRIPMRRPVAVALNEGGGLVVLDNGQGDAPQVEGGLPVLRVARAGDALAVSPSGALAVVRRGATSIELGEPDGSGFRAIELGRPTLAAVALGRPEGPGIELVYVADRQSGRIVEWRVAGEAATPVSWSTQVGVWGALAFRGEQLVALGADCRLVPIDFEAHGFFERSRSFVVGPLDSGSLDTEWHRVTAELAQTPSAEAGVTVEILAADDCEAYDPALSASDGRWEPPRELVCARDGAAAELAFLAARGRYAYLRVTLHGDARHTPTLRWLRVEFPRNSYLRYLPAVYSEEPVSRALTGRFLSLFEASHVELSSKIDRLRRLFQPYSLEPEFFGWLAERLDVLLEPDWPEAKQRRALGDALWLFRRRGTAAALARLLLDHGGPGISIIEGHRQRARFFLGDVALGCGSVLPGGCAPPRVQLDRGVRLGAGRLDSRPFVEADALEQRGELTIYLPPAVSAEPKLVARVTRLLELEAPAGAEVRVVAVAAGSALGHGGRLGIDLALGQRPSWRLAAEGEAPPTGTSWAFGMLLGREPGLGTELGLGHGPRLGMDSRL